MPSANPSQLNQNPNQAKNPFDDIDLGGPGPQAPAKPIQGNPFEGMDLSAPPPSDQFDQNAPSAGNVGQTYAPPTSTSSPLNQDVNVDPGLKGTYQRSYAPSDLIKNAKELGEVAVAYLDENPQSMLSVAKAFYGDENATLKNGKVWFKDEGDKKFRPITKEDQGLLSNAATSAYQSAGGKSPDGFPNFLARMSGNAAFMAGASIPSAVGAVGAPETAGGSLALSVISGASGGATQAAISSTAKAMLGIPENAADVSSDIMDKTGQGAAGGLILGSAGLAASNLTRVGLNKIQNSSMFQGAEKRLMQIAGLQDVIQGVGRDSGMITQEPAEVGRMVFGGKDLAGQEYHGATQELKKRMGDELGSVVDVAHEASGGEKVKIDDALDEMKSVLQKRGYNFSEGEMPHPQDLSELDYEDILKGKVPTSERTVPISDMASHPEAEMAPKLSDLQSSDKRLNALQNQNKQISSQIERLERGSLDDAESSKQLNDLYGSLASNESAISSVNDSLKESLSKNAFPGKEANTSAQKQIVDLYNYLRLKNKYDGFSVNDLNDAASAIGKIPDFDNEISRNPSSNAVLKQISGIMSDKKNSTIQSVLQDKDPELAKWASDTNQRYKEQIGHVNDMLQAFDKSGSAEAAGENLIPMNKKNPENILGIRQVFGDDSSQWKSIKGSWFTKLLNDNSPKGILNIDGFTKELSTYSKDSLDQLLPGKTQDALRYNLLRLLKIPSKDLTKNPQALNGMMIGIKNLAGGSLMAHATNIKTAATLFNLAKENGPLADHLAGDGMLALTQDAEDSKAKSGLLKAGTMFKNFLANSIRTGDEKVGYKYVPSQPLTQFLNSVWGQTADSEQGTNAPPPSLSTKVRTLGNTLR